MRECMDVDAVVARLKRIEGQVRGIMNMVQKDVPCEDILVQIGAAKSALHKTGQQTTEQLQQCSEAHVLICVRCLACDLRDEAC